MATYLILFQIKWEPVFHVDYSGQLSMSADASRQDPSLPDHNGHVAMMNPTSLHAPLRRIRSNSMPSAYPDYIYGEEEQGAYGMGVVREMFGVESGVESGVG